MRTLSVVMFVVAFLRHAAEAQQCACATDNLNVRIGAGTSYAIVYTLSPGECLPYRRLSQTAGGLTWYGVTYNGRSVWAASNWLNIRACAGSSGSQSACPRIISRSEWGARAPASYIGNMPSTPTYIFIHHGASSPCTTQSDCSARVRSFQNYHLSPEKAFGDIGYNFLVGEDGNVYEGRGWRKTGAHTYGYNNNGIAICFIGDFTSRTPNSVALQAAQQLIRCAATSGKVSRSYTLKGHRDVGQTACPGQALYDVIKSWPRFAAGRGLYSG